MPKTEYWGRVGGGAIGEVGWVSGQIIDGPFDNIQEFEFYSE